MVEIMLTGLYAIHVELTSKCNKQCWMCGRRKRDKKYPELIKNYGDMDLNLVSKIAYQLPKGIVVQFHNNGEPLLYPWLETALKLFEGKIRHFDTNGILLVEKAKKIIDNCECITISTFPNDPEANRQFENVKKFLQIRRNRKPRVMVRFTGNVRNRGRWDNLDILRVERILHSPMGSHTYEKKTVIPEIGICVEILTHMAIDRFGNVSPCVRFDPNKVHVIGDANKELLLDIWNGDRRKEMVKNHIEGHRWKMDICRKCEFWGIPRGG